MPSLNLQGKNIEGLIPALDARKVGKVHVVNGENVLFSVDGPKSGFGGHNKHYQVFENPQFVEVVIIDDTHYFTSDQAVLLLDQTTRKFVPLFTFSETVTTQYKWTFASVGSVHYFCHPDIGVYGYNTSTKAVTKVTADIPSGPKAIVESRGRLVVLGTTAYAWSAQDDGSDFATSISTGAGTQATSILGGTTLMVHAYDNGFFVFTTRGIIRNEFTDAVVPFRVRVLSRHHKLINSFCVTSLDDGSVIFLDRSGFYVTKGQVPERWQQLFSEFLFEDLKNYDLDQPASVRLTYDTKQKLVFLSFAVADATVYSFAWALYVPLERLGKFNKRHYAILHIEYTSGGDKAHLPGYVTEDKQFIVWTGIPKLENFPNTSRAYLFKPIVQLTNAYHDPVAVVDVMPSVCHIGAIYESIFSAYYGWYVDAATVIEQSFEEVAQLDDSLESALGEDWNALSGAEDWDILDDAEDWNTVVDNIFPSVMTFRADLILNFFVPLARDFTKLDSFIEVGLLRYEEQQYPDEMGLVTDLALEIAESGELDAQSEDWNTNEGEEDWNALSGEEDWGDGVVTEMTFAVSEIATLDGFTTFKSVTPDLEKDFAFRRQYSLLNTGVFHKVRLDANQVGQSFHLKSLEVAGSLDGRV